MHTHIRLLVLVAAAACGAAQAQIQIQGQTFKAGLIRYDAHSKTNGVTGIGLPPGADAEVGDATTFLFTYEIGVMPNVGVELVLGIPPKIKAKATGSVAFLGDIVTARIVAPTLLLNYHFGNAGDALRPYVGLGINYTKFVEVKSAYSFDVKIADSTGLAAQVGADYVLGKDWGLFGSLGWAQVKSKLVGTGAVVLQSTIDFRPLTYSFGASYRF